jgi:Quinohemoprotein amine dehydrogenase A, alpha subunit, haem binding
MKAIVLAFLLPLIGTKFGVLPEGKGKSVVESRCYACHSSDMLLQQRLTEKQWTAEVEKMTRWGAAVTDDEKPVIITYLAKHFGLDNKNFKATKVAPMRK